MIRSGLLAAALAALSACAPVDERLPELSADRAAGARAAAGPETASERRPRPTVCGSYRSALSRLLTRERFQCDPDIANFERELAEILNRTVDVDRPAMFWRACRAHDICYWTVGRSKAECDRAFHDDLVGECDAAFAGYEVRGRCRQSCITDAHLYYHFVSTSKLSRWSFAEAQHDAARVLDLVTGDLRDGSEVAEVDPGLALLIGEGCYRYNAGRCHFVRAAAWVEAQLESHVPSE